MLNFPSNPTEDQQVTINGKSYVYKAGRWLSLATFMLINGNLEARLAALESSALREKDKRIGCFFFHSAATPPVDALVADGTAISRSTYAALFAKIGVVFGAGDGSTTFNLPDLRGVVPRGLDLGKGYDVGRALGTYQADENKSHDHTMGGVEHSHSFSGTTSSNTHNHTVASPTGGSSSTYGGGGSPSSLGPTTITTSSNTHSHTFSGTTDSQSHSHTLAASGGAEARMKNVALLPCIWYA